MKYILLFENYNDANAWSNSNGYVTPNVVLITGGYFSGIHYNYNYIVAEK